MTATPVTADHDPTRERLLAAAARISTMPALRRRLAAERTLTAMLVVAPKLIAELCDFDSAAIVTGTGELLPTPFEHPVSAAIDCPGGGSSTLVLYGPRHALTPLDAAVVDAAAATIALAWSYFDPSSSQQVLDEALDGLSHRQRQIAEHLAAGRSNREIAESLYLSTETVKSHVSKIYEKLGVSNRAAAAAQLSLAGVTGGHEPRLVPAPGRAARR